MTVAVGREEKLYALAESTYATAASAPAATDALRFLSLSVAQAIERVTRSDKKATRSALETIQRRKSVSWSVEGYLLPSGAAGTAPDGWDILLTAGFGTQTINSSTSVVYTLLKENTSSVTLHRGIGNAAAVAVAGEMVRGAVVDSIEFTLSGQDEAKIKCSGFAADVLRAGYTLVTSDTSTVISLTVGTGDEFDVGQYIDAGNISAKVITAGNSNSITVASHTATNSNDKVSPTVCALSQTFVSTAVPIAGISGSCSLASSTLNILSASIMVKNNAVAHNNKYGADATTTFHMGNREVSGSFTVRLVDSNFVQIARAKAATKVSLSLVAGTVAGSIATFTLANVVLDYTAIPSVAVDDIIVTVPFKAYATTSFEDELVLTLT